MNDRTKFGQIIDNLFIPETDVKFEKEMKLSPLFQELQRIMPNKIFRYRSCSLRNVEAFNSDDVYSVTTDMFNDPYDGLPKYDEVRVKQFLAKMASPDNVALYQSQLKYLIRSGFPINESTMPISQFWSQDLVKEIIANAQSLTDDEKVREDLKSFFKEYADFFGENLQQIANMGKRSATVACFSETISSVTMWSHYADYHKGFALEYNEPSCLQNPEGLTMLFPVLYDDKRFDDTDHMLELLSVFVFDRPNSDILSHTRSLLHKSKQWEYEQEWRLIDTSEELNDSSVRVTKVKMKPTGIYYGHSISSENKAFLHDIALKKGINEYEMYIDYTSDKYEMKYQEMSRN